MRKQDLNKIIRQIALSHGTSPEEVRKEMQLAMDAARFSNDPNVQKVWASIPCKGSSPTLEEFIAYIVKRTMQS